MGRKKQARRLQKAINHVDQAMKRAGQANQTAAYQALALVRAKLVKEKERGDRG